MKSRKIKFKNKNGQYLSASLDLPVNKQPSRFALFAHCFTCNKNLTAVNNISRSLCNAGFGVLRFDFTGLGESEGDFSETDFSANIEDLVAASEHLESENMAPELLIGHSLGGAAAIYAGAELKSIRAIATIGAPSSPEHVENLFIDSKEIIEKEGHAEVSIGGRPFTIRKQFLEDLKSKNMSSVLRDMRKALLIAHSPQDAIVDIGNAARIYNAAHHPKSFISLDKADHLLSQREDSLYIGNVISTWADRYLPQEKKSELTSHLQVVAHIADEKYTTEIMAGNHSMLADEPEKSGGNNLGPTPYDLVLAGLGACTAMTLKMYAERKNWLLDEVNVHLSYDRIHADDCEACDSESRRLDRFTREIEIKGDLEEEKVAKLLEIADKCPVHKTLTSDIQIKTILKE